MRPISSSPPSAEKIQSANGIELLAIQPEHSIKAGASPQPAPKAQHPCQTCQTAAAAGTATPHTHGATATATATARHLAVQPVSTVLAPAEVYEYAIATAVHKAALPLPKLVLMGIASGMFIGLCFSTCALVGGTLSPEFRRAQPGAFAALYFIIGFPLALVLIVFCGGDLFPGNCFYSLVALLEGQIRLLAGLRLLAVSYLSNLAGCLLMVGLFAGGSIYEGRDDYLVHLGEAKCAAGWGVVLVRGILANILVCLAVWLANSSRDAAGKILGIFLPIMAFTAIGLEHCIANMFIVPMAMVQGADVTVGLWIAHNLIPATIGNWIGGAVTVGLLFSGIYGSPGAAVCGAWERGAARGQHSVQACLCRRESFAHVAS